MSAADTAPKKRVRAATESEPTKEERHDFWQAVAAESTQEMDEFLRAFPETVMHWKAHPEAMQQGPMVQYANVGVDLLPITPGKVQPQVKCASLLVLYGHGFLLAPAAYKPMLRYFFSVEATRDPGIQSLTDVITRRLEGEAKTKPAFLAAVLYAAAKHENLTAFQHFFHVGQTQKKRLLFDTTLDRDTNVLRAVATWGDVVVRRELVPDVMAKCTLAYILEESGPGELHSLLQDVACLPDADLLSLILTKVGVQHIPQKALVDAAAAAMKWFTRMDQTADPACAARYESIIVQLTANMDGAHLGLLEASIQTIKDCAIVTKRHLANNTIDPRYGQSCAVLHMLPQVEATCVAAAKERTAVDFHELISAEEAVKKEEVAYQARFTTHLQALANYTDVCRRLADRDKQVADLAAFQVDSRRLIQALTATVAKLSSVPEEAALQRSAEDTLHELDARLLGLQLPVAPIAAASALPAAAPVLAPPLTIRK